MLAQATKTGPAVAAFCEMVMADRPHPEQGFRTCLGVLSLVKTYGPARVDAACQRGVTILAGASGLATDQRFATNAARVRHREILIPLLGALTAGKPAKDWLAGCEAEGIPAGPVNDLARVFSSPQVVAREMRIEMPLSSGQAAKLIGNPLKLTRTPVTYSKAPPELGADTGAVLQHILGLTRSEIAALTAADVISGELTK